MLELLRTENGRQYGLDIFSTAAVTNLSRATRIKIQSDTLDESDGTGTCPGIGTQVFSVSSASSYSGTTTVSVQDTNGTNIPAGDRHNLIFRLNILGQQGVSPNYDSQNFSNGADGQNYRCSYQREVVLLHGGEGWAVGDQVVVTLDSAQGGASGGANATYTIRVEEIETTQINATVSSSGDGLIRPEPTPFDAQTAVTADTIIGGIIAELPSGCLLYTSPSPRD